MSGVITIRGASDCRGTREKRARTWAQRMAADEPPLVVVGKSDDRMVDFACAFPAEDPKWGTRIDNLHVLLDYKRQSIATRLMGTLGTRIAWSSLGYRSSFGSTMSTVPPALPTRRSAAERWKKVPALALTVAYLWAGA